MVKQVRPRFYEVQADGKVYVRNRRDLLKYEPRDDAEPAVEPLEVTEETPITGKGGKHFPRGPPGKGQTRARARQWSHRNFNNEYQTRSGRVLEKPARFNDFVID